MQIKTQRNKNTRHYVGIINRNKKNPCNSKFDTPKNGNFKQHFNAVNEFSWEIHKHKSCRTNQDL